MPNKDRNHDVVIRALQKAGWEIVSEQVYISIGNSPDSMRRLYIDIKAKFENRQVALIEVKALDVSPVHELMELIGQYLVYRAGLDFLDDDTPLYVAVTDEGYQSIVQHVLGQKVLGRTPVPLIIYNVQREEIIEWIPAL